MNGLLPTSNPPVDGGRGRALIRVVKQPRVVFRFDNRKSGLCQSNRISLDLLRGVPGQLPGMVTPHCGSDERLDKESIPDVTIPAPQHVERLRSSTLS